MPYATATDLQRKSTHLHSSRSNESKQLSQSSMSALKRLVSVALGAITARLTDMFQGASKGK